MAFPFIHDTHTRDDDTLWYSCLHSSCVLVFLTIICNQGMWSPRRPWPLCKPHLLLVQWRWCNTISIAVAAADHRHHRESSLYLSPSLLRNQWKKTVYDKVIIAMYDFLWWGDEYTGSWRAETDDVFCVVCWLKTPHCCDICIVCYARALCFAFSATSLSFSPCWRHEPKHLPLSLPSSFYRLPLFFVRS